MDVTPELVADLLAGPDLIRAVGTGRRKGQPAPQIDGREVRRVEVRWVEIKAGRHLQVVAQTATQTHTSNHSEGNQAAALAATLVGEPFANWHVDSVGRTHQIRVTKRGEWLAGVTRTTSEAAVDLSHDRTKQRLLAPDAPVLKALGISDAEGQIKPSRRDKYRQVEEFVRLLDATVTDAAEKGQLRAPTPDDPWQIVDLGCGNAYLTFAAHAHLSRHWPVRVIGVDVKQQSADHNAGVANDLGIAADFVVGTIAEAVLDRDPDVVLALHACDTATDDALARAVGWRAGVVLAAPCCHHDISKQLRQVQVPEPFAMVTRHGILRERLADTLTDALRASLLRSRGYRVDVVEFVESAHTPRNTLLRATLTGEADHSQKAVDHAADEYRALVEQWHLHPRLGELLDR